jgi:hypothetical protein
MFSLRMRERRKTISAEVMILLSFKQFRVYIYEILIINKLFQNVSVYVRA